MMSFHDANRAQGGGGSPIGFRQVEIVLIQYLGWRSERGSCTQAVANHAPRSLIGQFMVWWKLDSLFVFHDSMLYGIMQWWIMNHCLWLTMPLFHEAPNHYVQSMATLIMESRKLQSWIVCVGSWFHDSMNHGLIILGIQDYAWGDHENIPVLTWAGGLIG